MPEAPNLHALPEGLPVPADDGAATHLPGMRVPSVPLPATAGGAVDLAALEGRTVAYCYPMTGRPGTPLPEGWDMIPGARGCTPQACDFRDHHAELQALGARVFGISTQPTDYQTEAAERLHLPFALLSDSAFSLTDAMRLPTFEIGGVRLLRRLTLVVDEGIVERVFYPVSPPNRHADEVIRWLRERRQHRAQ
jgi:peroxiredoxin